METQTNPQDTDTGTPLWKQLAGAGVGMALALVLYSGYNMASPYLQAQIAYLYPPGTTAENPPPPGYRFSDSKDGISIEERTAARNARVYNRLTKPEEPEETMEPAAEDPIEDIVLPEETPAETRTEVESDGMTIDNWEEPAQEIPADEDAVAPVSTEVKHSGAENLPSSGLGLWLIALGAIAASALSLPRVRRLVVH